MNYYERYGGDYARDTAHLNLAENGAYGVLLDVQYSTERGLPVSYEALARMCRAATKLESVAVRSVVDQFFPVGADGLRWNPRAAREIERAKRRIETSRENGKHGGRKPGRNPAGSRQEPGGPPASNPSATCAGKALPDPIHQTPEVQKKNGKATPLSGKPDRVSEVDAVFFHWRQVLGHPNAQLDEKRRKVVRQRLEDGYTVERLCAAIDGCARSAWHMGENDRSRRFDDLELICRDSRHVDDFLKMPMDPSGRLSQAGQQTAANLAEWLKDSEARDAAD